MTFRLLGTLMVTAALCVPSEANTEVEQLRARIASLEKLVQQGRKLETAPSKVETQWETQWSRRVNMKKVHYEEKGRALAAHENYGNCLTTIFFLVCGALVMFMQAGFAILEAGSVTMKNTGTVLMKNLIDVCLGTLAWYFIGYGIAYGVADEDPGRFAGENAFAGNRFIQQDVATEFHAPEFYAFEDDIYFGGKVHFRDWFFQWAFCATAATIVSGGVAERMALPAYVLYSIVMTGVIYPFVVYWTWSTKGWLTIGSGEDADSADGYSDFAGSGIVHLVGGVGALTGAILLGPRKDRFIKPELFKPCAPELCVLGTFILWFGWYGFNCGSQLSMAGDGDAYAACLVAMNSTLAAATGGTTVFLIRLAVARGKEFDMCGMCNGILAGLVAICAGVANVEPSMAIVTGLVGGIFEELGHFLLLALKVDDPLDAFPVHGCGGIAGILTRPLFDWSGAKDTMFGWHWIGLGSIGAWVAVWSLFLMGIMKVIGKSKPGLFRVSAEEEETGGDTKLSHSPLKPYEKDTIWNDPAPAPASHEM